MLIEFVGISGSGKSTVIAAVTSELRNRGIKVRNLYKFCESAQLIDEHHWKQSAPQEQKMEHHRMLSLMQYCAENTAMVQNLNTALMALPAQQSQCAITLTCLKQLEHLDHQNLVIIVDEGIIHRAAEAHLAAGDDAAFTDFLKVVHYPDLLVHLSVPSDVAETRALERVPAKRRQAVSKARPSPDHFTSLSNMLGRLTEGARRAGRQIAVIDGLDGISSNAKLIAGQIEECLNTDK